MRSQGGDRICLSHRTSGGETGRARRTRAWSRPQRSKAAGGAGRVFCSGRSVTAASAGRPAVCSSSRAGSCLVVPAPGVIRVRTSGGGIAVAVFGGLAASRRPEQPHLTRPSRDRRAPGPASSRRRRNSPDPGPGLSERHCHQSRLYRRPLCSWVLPRSSPAGPGRPHGRLGGARPGPSRGTGPSGRPPGWPRLALTAARPRRQAARLRDRGPSRRPFACSFGVAVRCGPHRRRRGRCRWTRRVGREPPNRTAGRVGRGCRRVLLDGVSCCSHRRQRRCPRAGPPAANPKPASRRDAARAHASGEPRSWLIGYKKSPAGSTPTSGAERRGGLTTTAAALSGGVNSPPVVEGVVGLIVVVLAKAVPPPDVVPVR